MTLSPLSSQLVSRVARAVAGAGSVDTALTALALEISDALRTRAVAFARTESSWRAVTASPFGVDARAWLPIVSAFSGDACTLVHCDDEKSIVATLIPIAVDGAPEAIVIADGDWTALKDSLCGVSVVVRLALEALREREKKHRAERQLIGTYAMARRLSRLGSVDSVAQQIVDSVAQLVKADRVSLSMYKSSDNALAIVATHGYPRSAVADVRVRPGEWVLGHVYSSKRALFVSDVRVVPEMARHGGSYRTFGFAAVPLLAGRETVGVLTVTDKVDGQPFNHDDEMVLRGLSVTAAISLVAARSNDEAAQLAYAATIDSLTGLMNRTSLDNRLHQEVERSRREKTSLAVLMADVDDFKRINDSRGHHVGDTVLRTVAAVIRSAVRVFDVCARYGGDEFAIVMPNCDRESAVACAERIRSRLRDLPQQSDDGAWSGTLTMSIGVAVINEDEDAPDLIQRADRCLYQAKGAGKDAVYSDQQPEPLVLGPHPVPARVAEFEPRSKAADTPPEDSTRLPYVLVVDSDDARVNLCLQAVQPFQCGLLVARTGALAATLIDRFGPPMLLIVDLMLPSGDAFAAIDALPHDSNATDVLAWSASREAREFASARIRAGRVISAHAGDAALSSAIQGLLHRREKRENPAASDEPDDDCAAMVASLIDRVRAVCTVPGIAIYLKDPAHDGFRVKVEWSSEDAPPPTPDVPIVFDRVRESGRTVFHRDTAGSLSEPNAARGVVGVPLLANRQVAGVICAFDAKPLLLDAATIAALEDLGYTALQPPGRDGAGKDGLATRADFMARRGAADIARVARTETPASWAPALLERSGGEFAVARELSRAKREGRQVSIVLFSVAPGRALSPDPRENDLDEISDTLLRAVRQSDLPIRWSVTELLVVLPGLGNKEARSVAERVRAALSAGVKHRLPVSGGVEEVEHDGSFFDSVDRARQKVAIAVDRGHNRVI
jgi:diguanylate cyclase (GGDEF)-like protein